MSIKSVKYLFKYVYKGHDCINLQLSEKNRRLHATIKQLEWKLNHVGDVSEIATDEESYYFNNNDDSATDELLLSFTESSPTDDD